MSAGLDSVYPESSRERDRWIVSQRPQRNQLDPWRPYAFFVEEEHSESGEVQPVATVLLTNRECPWRCVMCDLWKNTLPGPTPTGAIPHQIDSALSQLPEMRRVKLYNSGSFFDRLAVPTEDYPGIAQLLKKMDRTIVECHPSLVGDDCLRFNDLLDGTLEVAMGLETAHPQVLAQLNKKMTLDQFAAAAEGLRRNGIALRVFILVKPPFMKEEESLFWACKSLELAFSCGATAATLIPTRAGNGAVDRLAENGAFSPPALSTLEATLEYGLTLKRGRVFADLWETSHLTACPGCFQQRMARLRTMNLEQRIAAHVPCSICGNRDAR